MRQFTAEDVRRVLANPIYVGMGPFPAVAEEDLWIKGNVRRMEEEGIQETFAFILKMFQESVPDLDPPEPDTYVDEAKENPSDALRHLLGDLRDLVGEPPGQPG
jgi:hypothetical protein